MSRQHFGAGAEAVTLLALSLAAAVAANSLHSKPLPWLRDGGAAAIEKSLLLTKAGAPGLKADEALRLWQTKAALFVDARSPAVFVAGHIPGAVNVTPDPLAGEDILTQADRLPKDRPLIIYCDSMACSKSKELAETLSQLGFTNLRTLQEGLEGWQAVNGPLDMGDKGGAQ